MNRGSNVHYLLLQMLDEHGLTLDDVRVNYTPLRYPLTPSDFHSVDAWMMWDPLLSDAQLSGDMRIIEDGHGKVLNQQFYLRAAILLNAQQICSRLFWMSSNRLGYLSPRIQKMRRDYCRKN